MAARAAPPGGTPTRTMQATRATRLALARRLGVRPNVIRRTADGLLSTDPNIP